MALTVTGLATTLATLSIAGVTSISSPTEYINEDALPVGYPRLPVSSNEASSFASDYGLDELTCDYVILVEPLEFPTIPADYLTTAGIMDALITALKTEMAADGEINGWTMRMAIEELPRATYWAVVANIRASG